jgi:hypothetical protein
MPTVTSYTVLRIEENTKNISHKVDGISKSTQAILEQSERDRLLRKLSPDQIDLDETYHSALRLRKGSTGQWLTLSPALQSFLSTDVSSLFWLSGSRKWFRGNPVALQLISHNPSWERKDYPLVSTQYSCSSGGY